MKRYKAVLCPPKLHFIFPFAVQRKVVKNRKWKKKTKNKKNFHFATGKHCVSYFSLLIIFFFNFFLALVHAY